MNPNPAAVPRTPLVKIVFVLGSGRCGSTLLDAIIGSSVGAVSTGELDHLSDSMDAATHLADTSTLAVCSCGSRTDACALWSRVWADLAPARVAGEPDRGVERYERVLISLPASAGAWMLHTASYRDHLKWLDECVNSIVRHSGAHIVVDSSKNPARGWLYAQLSEARYDLRFVHIVRDGRDVLDSNLRHFDPATTSMSGSPWSPSATALFSTAYWVYMNVHASILGYMRGDRYLRIRFEDLLSHPLETIDRLAQFLDVDFSLARVNVRDGLPVSRGHILFGNRSKMSPILRANLAGTDLSRSRLRSSLVFSIFGGWLSAIYQGGGTSDRPLGPRA